MKSQVKKVRTQCVYVCDFKMKWTKHLFLTTIFLSHNGNKRIRLKQIDSSKWREQKKLIERKLFSSKENKKTTTKKNFNFQDTKEVNNEMQRHRKTMKTEKRNNGQLSEINHFDRARKKGARKWGIETALTQT